MADLAFDPYATPYGPEVAEAPPPSDVQVAQAPPEPAPGEIREKAIIPGLPDRTPVAPGPAAPASPAAQQPAAPPGGLTFVDRPDEEDQKDYLTARQAEQEAMRNLREHQPPYNSVTPPTLVNPKDLPKWQELEQLREHYPNLTPKERNEAERTILREQKRIETETKYQNDQAAKAYTAKHRDDMARIDAPRETMEARQKTFDLVDGARSAIETEIKTMQASKNPSERQVGDYTLRTSPLGTMKPPEFSEAVSQLGTYNGRLTARKAIEYGIILGSPVNRDEKTGELKPGANVINGKPVIGKGATAYQVVGRDSRDNVLVRMPDRQIIRVPATTFNDFAKVRERGYAEQKKMWAERRKGYEDAAKPDLLTRGVEAVRRAIQ